MSLANKKTTKTITLPPPFYGTGEFTVIAINPTKEELVNAGINAQQEPQYVGIDMQGTKKSKVAFLLASTEVITKDDGTTTPKVVDTIDFIISDASSAFTTKSGESKITVMNHKGMSRLVDGATATLNNDQKKGFLPNNEELVGDCVYISKEGEADLLEFILTWLNVDMDIVDETDGEAHLKFGNFGLPTFEELVKGDVSGLRLDENGDTYLDEGYGIRCAVFVSQKGYSHIWKEAFDKVCDPRVMNIKRQYDYKVKSGKALPGYMGTSIITGLEKYDFANTPNNPPIPQMSSTTAAQNNADVIL